MSTSSTTLISPPAYSAIRERPMHCGYAAVLKPSGDGQTICKRQSRVHTASTEHLHTADRDVKNIAVFQGNIRRLVLQDLAQFDGILFASRGVLANQLGFIEVGGARGTLCHSQSFNHARLHFAIEGEPAGMVDIADDVNHAAP